MNNNNWTLDPSHSELLFKVKHMMISSVSGQFDEFSANMNWVGNDFSNMHVDFTANIHSINTRNKDRDEHLKSADFFDADLYPQMTFSSNSIKVLNANEFELMGNLTIKDQTHPITIIAEHSGIIKDPYGNNRIGFEITCKISRKKFNLTWNELTETGGVIVSDEVKIMANIQFIQTV